MPLHIVIGFNGPRNSAAPKLVYLGRDGVEAQEAMDADKESDSFEVYRNPLGFRKNNPQGPAALAAAEEAKSAPEAPDVAANTTAPKG